MKIINVIAFGRFERYVKGNKTVVLSDGEYEAVLALTKNGQRQSWLLTGWDKITPDENGKVSANTVSTQANPTFSREDLGAVVIDNAKLQNKSDIDKPVTVEEKRAKVEEMSAAYGVKVRVVTDVEEITHKDAGMQAFHAFHSFQGETDETECRSVKLRILGSRCGDFCGFCLFCPPLMTGSF